MKKLFHPSLISLDNQAHDVIDDFKENRSVSEEELIRAEVDLFQTMSERSGYTPEACRQLFKEELGKFPPRYPYNETESDRQFIESAERLRLAFPPRKHWIDAVEWYWRLLAVAAFGLAVYVYGRMAGAW